MCGRYVLKFTPEQLEDLIELSQLEAAMAQMVKDLVKKPRYNIAPSQQAVVARQGAISTMEWGLIPSWSKGRNAKFSTINARSESIATSPAYKASFQRRRCIVPATGYYEWDTRTQPKTPYYLHRQDDRPLYFAGVWDDWESPTEVVQSFSIVTTDSTPEIGNIHHRMPVFLESADIPLWLSNVLGKEVAHLMRPNNTPLKYHPVSTAVNSPRNDTPELIQPYQEPTTGELDLGI